MRKTLESGDLIAGRTRCQDDHAGQLRQFFDDSFAKAVQRFQIVAQPEERIMLRKRGYEGVITVCRLIEGEFSERKTRVAAPGNGVMRKRNEERKRGVGLRGKIMRQPLQQRAFP